jgi:hypothetical protein
VEELFAHGNAVTVRLQSEGFAEKVAACSGSL